MKIHKIWALPGSLKRPASPRIAKVTGIEQTLRSQKSYEYSAFRVAKHAIDFIPENEIRRVGAVIVVTQTPPYLCPSFACKIRAALELPETAICFDVNQGCAGFVMGLQIANSVAKLGQLVLLIVGDHLAQFIGEKDEALHSVFSDCVTATIMEVTDKEHIFETRHPNGNPNAVLCPREGFLSMNGLEVHHFSQSRVPEFTMGTTKIKDTSVADIIFFHQANETILNGLREKITTLNKAFNEENAPSILREYGNASSASIPLTICVKGGVPAHKFALLVGFGSGLTMAKTFIEQNSDVKTEIIEE